MISTYDLKELVERGEYYLQIDKELNPLLGKETLTAAERLHFNNLTNLQDHYEAKIRRICSRILHPS